MNRRTSKIITLTMGIGFLAGMTSSIGLADVSSSAQGTAEKADKTASDAKQATSTAKEKMNEYSNVTQPNPDKSETKTEVEKQEKTTQAGQAGTSTDEKIKKNQSEMKNSADEASKSVGSSVSEMTSKK